MLATACLLLRGVCVGNATASPGGGWVCQHPPYQAHVVSSSPLVVYLAGFVTAAESAHLQAVTKDTFAHSAVAEKGTADGRAIHGVRTSQSTSVPADDAVARCLEERALRFQGLFQPDARRRLEPLQLVKYGPGEHFHFHTDWFPDPAHASAAVGGNRASSFFAYVFVSDRNASAGPLRGGGTNFPLLDAPPADDDTWCAYIDCDEPWHRGVTFRPLQGNAVYWDNLQPAAAVDQGQSQGDPRNLHAGLPVVSGEKIGMNIWTRQEWLANAVKGYGDKY